MRSIEAGWCRVIHQFDRELDDRQVDGADEGQDRDGARGAVRVLDGRATAR